MQIEHTAKTVLKHPMKVIQSVNVDRTWWMLFQNTSLSLNSRSMFLFVFVNQWIPSKTLSSVSYYLWIQSNIIRHDYKVYSTYYFVVCESWFRSSSWRKYMQCELMWPHSFLNWHVYMCFLEPNRISIRKSLKIAFKKEMYQSRDTLMDDPVRVSMETCYICCDQFIYVSL